MGERLSFTREDHHAYYSQCNSTSEGPNSLFQKTYVNSLDGTNNFRLSFKLPLTPCPQKYFCIWAQTKPGNAVGQMESHTVAWCSKGGHGTRVMPEGTLTGVQLTKTPDYIQIVGFMNQTKIKMVHSGIGAKMGPHEANEVLFF